MTPRLPKPKIFTGRHWITFLGIPLAIVGWLFASSHLHRDWRAAASPVRSGTLGHVNVWGAVEHGGPIAIHPTGPLTITAAISAAGGFSPVAKDTKVRVHRVRSPTKIETLLDLFGVPRRKGTTILRVNVEHIIKSGDHSNDISLQPNDVIIVEERFFNF